MERRFLTTLHYAGGHDNQGLDEFHDRRNSNRIACDELKERLDDYFSRWEKLNGFRPGAGAILVPAGWQPKQSSQAA